MQDIHELRIDLAAALRLAVRHDMHEGICNHFSVAVGDDRYLINPWGSHWSELRASDLVLVDGEGQVLEGDGEVETTAVMIHGRIHRACPQAVCVLHTHMPWATSLTVVEGAGLEMCEQNALRFHERIAVDDDYRGLVLDGDEGGRIAARLGNRSVLFLAAHGVIVTGPTVACAWDDLYYLERACRLQVLGRAMGRPLRQLPEDVISHTAAQFARDRERAATVHFEAQKRTLVRDEPDYVS